MPCTRGSMPAVCARGSRCVGLLACSRLNLLRLALTSVPVQTLTQTLSAERVAAIPAPVAGVQYDTLVLQGGGVRGVAYAALGLALEESGVRGELRRVAGTSAGAQAAALLAVGYNGSEFYEATLRTDYASLIESPRPSGPDNQPWLLAELPFLAALPRRWANLVEGWGFFSSDNMQVPSAIQLPSADVTSYG
eukprot:SAG11_NODE_157_length_14147_cov_8.545202_2_plen_193_part_00